jgi:hypothetical protein
MGQCSLHHLNEFLTEYMYVPFSVSPADFLAVLRKFGFQFFFICIFFFTFEKKTLLCVCLLISFNFILRDNALVFCTQSLPATKYSLLHYWLERRALVSKCMVINLSYAALYLRVRHTSKVNTASSAKTWCNSKSWMWDIDKRWTPNVAANVKEP